MRNNFLSSSLNSVVSLDMDSSWAAKSWGDMYWNPNSNQGPYKKYKNTSSSSLVTDQESVWPGNLNQGKVRQLFLERRGGKGWDRSYPLEPLKNKAASNSERNTEHQSRSPTDLENYTSNQTLSDRAYFFKKLPNIGGAMQSQNTDSSSAKKRISKIPQPKASERLKSPATTLSKDIKKLAISPSKPLGDDGGIKSRSTELRKPATPQRKDEEKSRSLQKVAIENKSHPSESPVPTKTRTPVQSPAKTEKINVNSTPEKTKVQRNSNPDLPQCSICGRSFASDRIELHEKICKKSKTKKRKIFDPVKQRVAGTEAESYVKKAPSHQKAAPPAAPNKSNWRKKHEEFIANIRAAKQVKEHLAKGGKLSDLPPPPPLDTSDYIQCPHCGRKFNQSAAERHIPKCATMKHNKPKKVNKK